MSFIFHRRGQAFTWFAFILILFIAGSLFLILNRPLVLSIDSVAGTIEGSQFEETGNKLNFLWSYLPLGLLLVMIIWVVLQSQLKPGGV